VEERRLKRPRPPRYPEGEKQSNNTKWREAGEQVGRSVVFRRFPAWGEQNRGVDPGGHREKLGVLHVNAGTGDRVDRRRRNTRPWELHDVYRDVQARNCATTIKGTKKTQGETLGKEARITRQGKAGMDGKTPVQKTRTLGRRAVMGFRHGGTGVPRTVGG